MTEHRHDPPPKAARYRDLFVSAHDNGAECAYCPVCTALALARRSRPEVVEHLAGAAREIVAALGIILEEAEARMRAAEEMHRSGAQRTEPREAPDEPSAPRARPSKLRRIDIG